MGYEYIEAAVIMWREGQHHCELWRTEKGAELRVYTSHVLTYTEPVLSGTDELRQAAALLARFQGLSHPASPTPRSR